LNGLGKNSSVDMLEPSWEVYIIVTESGKLYTGITSNIEKRFKAHQNEKTGARFFHFSPPEKIVYREKMSNRSEASKRENAIKKMSRIEKIALIEEYGKN
jgi:putative endonuclease